MTIPKALTSLSEDERKALSTWLTTSVCFRNVFPDPQNHKCIHIRPCNLPKATEDKKCNCKDICCCTPGGYYAVRPANQNGVRMADQIRIGSTSFSIDDVRKAITHAPPIGATDTNESRTEHRFTHFPEGENENGLNYEARGLSIFPKSHLVKDVRLILDSHGSAKGEDEGTEESNDWANQIDGLLFDTKRKTLWIVECKKKRDMSIPELKNDGLFSVDNAFAKQFNKQTRIAHALRTYLKLNWQVRHWLISSCDPAELPKGWVRAADPKTTPPELPELAEEIARLVRILGSNPMSFEAWLEKCNFFRDWRTLEICVKNSLVNATANRTLISGVAGSGKSLLLVYHALCLLTRSYLTTDFDMAKYDSFRSIRTIYLCGNNHDQVKRLQSIIEFFRDHPLLKGKWGPAIVHNGMRYTHEHGARTLVLVCHNKAENTPPITDNNREIAILLDEAQDTVHSIGRINTPWETLIGSILSKTSDLEIGRLVLARDRLQSANIANNEPAQKKGTHHISLDSNYRMPTPIYLASLALLYGWTSNRYQWIQPSENCRAEDLLKSWGIFEKPSSTPKPHYNSLFWWATNKYEEYRSGRDMAGRWIKKKHADWNAPQDANSRNRISLRRDIHPNSANPNCIELSISGTAPSDSDTLHVSYNSIDNWNIASRQASITTTALLDLIKGADYKFVRLSNICSIVNDLLGQDEDSIKRLRQSLYIIISRARCYLQLVPNINQDCKGCINRCNCEFLHLKPRELPETFAINRAGTRENWGTDEKREFESSYGLCYFKQDSESGMQWHLTFKLNNADLIRATHAIDTVHDQEQPKGDVHTSNSSARDMLDSNESLEDHIREDAEYAERMGLEKEQWIWENERERIEDWVNPGDE